MSPTILRYISLSLLTAVLLCLLGLTSTAAARSAPPDSLGTVSANQIECTNSGLSATACYSLYVSCPGIENYTVYLKAFVPDPPVIGVVTLTQGGWANILYEQYLFGSVTIENLVNSGFTTVEITFGKPFKNEAGWQYLVDGAGVRAASCRYATVTAWIKNNLSANVPLCASGVSAGAAMIGEGLAHYSLDQYLAFAELVSGPPFSRVDEACIPMTRPTSEYCSGAYVGTEVNLTDAIQYLDPAYPPKWCSQDIRFGNSAHQQQFFNDSITSSDANLFYPNTTVWFLYGGLDDSSASNQGEIYRSQIASSASSNCVADAPHNVPDVYSGAQRIADDIIQQCHQTRHKH